MYSMCPRKASVSDGAWDLLIRDQYTPPLSVRGDQGFFVDPGVGIQDVKSFVDSPGCTLEHTPRVVINKWKQSFKGKCFYVQMASGFCLLRLFCGTFQIDF